MGTSFDDRAKAAAERSPGVAGLSRRQLIQRGAFVVGTAWTAPMLLSATPAWAGASLCTGGNPVYSVCPDNTTTRCCPTDQACVLSSKTLNFTCDVPVGGLCNNYGNGQCSGGYSRCNHLDISVTTTSTKTSVCGGPGAFCYYNNNTVCIPTSPCYPLGINVTGARCGGEGAPCTSSTQCANGSTGGAPNLVCIGATASVNGTCLTPPLP